MTDRTDLCVRTYASRQVMSAHSHSEPLMSIVLRGGFRETIGKSERLYSRDHVTFFPAGRMHAQAFGPSGAQQIIFRPKEDWLAWLSDGGVRLEAAPHINRSEFRLLGERLLIELKTRDALSELAREGLLLEIIAAFGRGRCERPMSRVPSWLREAREFLYENTGCSLTLREVARAAGRHETHLAREFRRYFGTSVVGYMRRLRIERAARLLEDDELEISTIAFDCGFSSHSHLSREFRLFYGVAPSHYRSLSRK